MSFLFILQAFFFFSLAAKLWSEAPWQSPQNGSFKIGHRTNFGWLRHLCPELVTSIQAALSGAPGIAIGNVVGSNIANILLIIGVSAVLLPMVCPREAILRDGMVMSAATILFVLACFVGELNYITGLIFSNFAWLISWSDFLRRKERKRQSRWNAWAWNRSPPLPFQSIPLNLLIACGGMGLLVLGQTFWYEAQLKWHKD